MLGIYILSNNKRQKVLPKISFSDFFNEVLARTVLHLFKTLASLGISETKSIGDKVAISFFKEFL